MKLKIFTVLNSEFRNNEKSIGFDYLFNSANKNKLPITVVANNKRFDGSYYAKLLPMIEYVEHCDGDDIILFTDAFDCLFLDDEDTIIENFLKTNCKVLISGESFCWPYDSLAKPISDKVNNYIQSNHYQSNKLSPHDLFKYPCAGVLMGYKQQLLYRLYRWKDILDKKEFPSSNLADHSFLCKSDQGAAAIDFVKNDSDDYKIDIYPHICFNHYNIEKNYIRFENGKVLYNKFDSQKFPSIVHFNSGTYRYIQDFQTALNLSTINNNVYINEGLLNIKFDSNIQQTITVHILNSNEQEEYNVSFNNINKDVIYWLSTMSINKKETVTVIMKHNDYIFYKKTLDCNV